MSDRPLVPGGESEVEAELERRLRAAFRAATAPETPTAVHAEVARLAAAPDVRTRAGLAGWLSRGWLAVALAVSILVVGSLFSGGSSPAPTMPSAPPGPSASTDPSQAAASSSPAAACDVSPGTIHGTWWREIGGPNAFFNWEEEEPRAAGSSWKLFVRFDPDAGPGEEVSIWAGQLGSDVRAVGQFNSRMDPSNIYQLDSPAPDLPGGWYFFEQSLPTAGCWRLTAAIDGRVVGTATVEVGPPSSRAAPPTNAPTPTIEPTPAPVATMKPSSDDMLPLAGRDGLPGSLYCGPYMPFGFDALEAPTGAEDRVGPEFDLLRSTAAGTDPDPGGDFGPDPTFREVARDANAVLFLYQLPADTIEDFRYLYIRLERDGTGWHLANSGDCTPRAVAPPGYRQAKWTLDPAFPEPDKDTRTLHILIDELACSSGRSASGRISPAFVTWDERQLVIEVFVESIGGGDCQGAPRTPATLRLPVPAGDRRLVDPVTLEQGGTGG